MRKRRLSRSPSPQPPPPAVYSRPRQGRGVCEGGRCYRRVTSDDLCDDLAALLARINTNGFDKMAKLMDPPALLAFAKWAPLRGCAAACDGGCMCCMRCECCLCRARFSSCVQRQRGCATPAGAGHRSAAGPRRAMAQPPHPHPCHASSRPIPACLQGLAAQGCGASADGADGGAAVPRQERGPHHLCQLCRRLPAGALRSAGAVLGRAGCAGSPLLACRLPLSGTAATLAGAQPLSFAHPSRRRVPASRALCFGRLSRAPAPACCCRPAPTTCSARSG